MVKIIISKDEIYEIKIPSELNAIQLQEILGKFDNIAKIIKINTITGTNFKTFKTKFNQRAKHKIYKKKANANPNYDSKDKVLDLLQYFYHGTKEDRARILKITGEDKINFGKRIWTLCHKYDVQAGEIGLINFANLKAGIKSKKIPNYVIRSHTGLFDEVEK
jgi:hypothetical protein